MKRKYVHLCIVVVLLSLGIVNAQETRMVPMYRCLWIGPEGGTWNNSGGDPNAVWEAYELTWTDSECYLIDWILMENPVYTWPDILSMAEFRDNAVVSVNEPPPTAIQGLVIRDANLTVNNDLTVVGDGQDDGFMAVCVGQGADGVLNINDGILTCGSTEGPLEGQTGPVANNYGGSRFFVGRAINDANSAVGIVNQYGGTVFIANHLQIADIGYGEARELLGGYDGWGNLPLEQRQAIAATSANSTYNLYDGVIEVTNNIEVGKANGSYGIFNVYGGEITVGGALRSYYSGEMTIDGGTVTVTGDLVWPRRATSHGVLTLKKGSLSFDNAVICEDGTGLSEVNILGGSFDCSGNWEANGSGGTGENQQTIRIDCGNVENVHFGSLDAALDTNDLMDLVLVVPKDTEPNNAATKVWIDGNVTFNGWAAIRIDVNKDFAGQVGDMWELVNIGGNVTGMEQVLIINDSSKYIFSVDLKEREVDSVIRKIITAELILINPDPPLSFSTEEPTPDADDIYNFVGSTLDSENVGGNDDSNTYVAHDRSAQGQTFLTGSAAGYIMTGFWVQHVGYVDNPSDQSTWYQMPAGSELGIRVTDPAASGTDAFVLASQTYVMTGEEPDALPAELTNTNNGTGTWIHITLDEPVPLAANTLYGFDLVSILSDINLFFETAGIDDSAPGGNPYPDGAAYTSGASGAADNVLNPETGDRVFLVELDAM